MLAMLNLTRRGVPDLALRCCCLSWHSLDFNRGFWLCHSPVSHWGEAEEGPPSAPTGSSQCPLARADLSPPAPHPTPQRPAVSFAGGELQPK